jgi:O-antigen/teichoic acid export membrane protein
MNAVYPMMIGALGQETDRIRIRNLFRKSLYTLLPLSLLLSVAGYFIAPYLVWVRPEFVASIQIFRILCFGLPVFFVTGVTLWTLIAFKKQGTLVWLYATAMVINVVCNILLIPLYGSVAAAYTTIGSEAFVLVVSLFLLRREIRL